MRKFICTLLFIFVLSCNSIEFVYKEDKNLVNPLYQKTEFTTSGFNINFMNSYLPMFFGENKENLYSLLINIEQEKINRSVEENQATSKLRYELKFVYTLILNSRSCVIYEKELLSYFSIIPKSSGYNYGTDASLEKKYELVVVENLNRFVSIFSDTDIDNC